jgi:hypothetical protein
MIADYETEAFWDTPEGEEIWRAYRKEARKCTDTIMRPSVYPALARYLDFIAKRRVELARKQLRQTWMQLAATVSA